MAKHWFDEAFGKALDDIHHELIQRGVYQRNDRIGGSSGLSDPPSMVDLAYLLRGEQAPRVRDPDADMDHGDGKSMLDQLYETNPELFSSQPGEPDNSDHERDHGIDR